MVDFKSQIRKKASGSATLVITNPIQANPIIQSNNLAQFFHRNGPLTEDCCKG
jgi:hypothetical protein